MRLGLGQVSGRELTSWEVAQFLARHPIVAGKVLAHNELAAVSECSNITTPWSIWDPLAIGGPIPGSGLSVEDSAFGLVVVFPDASCELHYSAVEAGGVLEAGELEQPVYSSPPAPGSPLEDLSTGLKDIAWIVGLGLIGLAWIHGRGGRA